MRGDVQQRRRDIGKQDVPELVRRAQAGNADAFEALIRQHYRQIFHLALRGLGNRADAEDVAQMVCIKLGSALSGYDGRAAFSTWLYRVVLSTVHDWRRRDMRRIRLQQAAAESVGDHLRADQEDALIVADIWRFVRELPEKQRDAVILVYGQELSQAEAAAVMGCKEVTVSWHIHKARKALRDKL